MTPVHWMASPVIVVRKLECSFQEKKYVYIVQKMNIKILGIGQIGGGGDTFVFKSGILRVLN